MSDNEGKFWTTREICKILKLSLPTLWRMMKRGELRGYKLGRQWRFSDEQVSEFLNKAGAKEKETK